MARYWVGIVSAEEVIFYKCNHHWARKLSHPPGDNLNVDIISPNELNGKNFIKFGIAQKIEKVLKASKFWYCHETYLDIS